MASRLHCKVFWRSSNVVFFRVRRCCRSLNTQPVVIRWLSCSFQLSDVLTITPVFDHFLYRVFILCQFRNSTKQNKIECWVLKVRTCLLTKHLPFLYKYIMFRTYILIVYPMEFFVLVCGLIDWYSYIY